MRSSRRSRIALAVLALLAVPILVLGARSPAADRAWAEDMRVLAYPELRDDGRVRLHEVRDWRYTRDSVVSRRYLDVTYDPADIVDLWLYEQEFDGQGLVAHTFLVFEFAASYGHERFLGLSMEARREVGEDYSIVRGIFRGFEAALIWATEEDLVTRRVVYAGDPVVRHRLDIPADSRAGIFVNLLQETRALEAEPRWYNTILYNCTSSLIRYANESRPDAIPLHYSWVLTGRIDEYLDRLGYLDPSATRTLTPGSLAREGLRRPGAVPR